MEVKCCPKGVWSALVSCGPAILVRPRGGGGGGGGGGIGGGREPGGGWRGREGAGGGGRGRDLVAALTLVLCSTRHRT